MGTTRALILVDSSAWIEYLRERGSQADVRLQLAFADGETIASTEPVVMEVLAGAKDETQLRLLQSAFASAELLTVGELETWLDAADLYRTGRRVGVTIRSHLDCLIAAVAIREAVPVLHHDRDFTSLARFSRLQLAT